MSENEKKWYVLRAISGKEAKVKEYLDKTNLEVEKQITDLPSSHEQSWDELNDVFLSILK